MTSKKGNVLVVGVVFLLTFLNEVYSRRTNLDLMLPYLLIATVGALMAGVSLVGAVVWTAFAITPSQCGELCQPGNWFWYGLWLVSAGAAVFLALLVSVDSEQPNVVADDTGNMA